MPKPIQTVDSDLSHWDSPCHWRWFVVPFFVCLICAAVLNVVVNPFGLYGQGGFHQKLPNFREDKLGLVAKLTPAPSTLILGSSRTMCISPEFVEEHLGGVAFNFGMVRAKPEDFYAVLRIVVDDLGIPVSNVILALDHSAFNSDVPAVAESRNNPTMTKYFVDREGSKTIAHSALPMLISMEQTRSSFGIIRRLLPGATKENARVLPNGLVDFFVQDQQIAEGTYDLDRILDKRIRTQPVRGMHLDKFTQPDQFELAYIDRILEFCQEKNITIYPYFTTYHPRQVEVLNSFPNNEVLVAVVDAVAESMAEYGIELHDYTNVDSFGGSIDLFYDEVHMRPENEALLINHLLGGEGF